MSQVTQYFAAQNLKVLKTNPTSIEFEGAIGDIQKALQIEIHQYIAQDGRLVFGPTNNPQVDATMAAQISGITGLDNFAKHKKNTHKNSGVLKPLFIGSGPGGGLAPADIQKAYVLPAALSSGSGQTLALFELDGYTPSDINTYASFFGITTPPTLQNILIDGSSGAAGGDADEVTLDIELMMAVAPGASKILVYEAPNSLTGAIDLLTAIANDDRASEVSISWAFLESDAGNAFLTSENMLFMQMAAQGQSVFAGSGDSGAYGPTPTLSAYDPTAQPYVTSVGGTTLALNANGTYASETTWSGSGGGMSGYWTIPSWQSGLGNASNLGSQTMRMTPDVSLNADPNSGYAIYLNGAWNIYGGTSASTPLWAAFVAIVNQQRLSLALTPLGFATPAIYQLAMGSQYSLQFHDIADSSSNGSFFAVPGYDLCTGWGTINSSLLSGLLNSSFNPAAPVLSASSYNTVVNLTWTGVGSSAVYTVNRALSASGPFYPVDINAAATSYGDVELTNGTSYYYNVTAKFSDGYFATSNVVSGTPAMVVPGAPSKLNAVVSY